MTKMLMKSNDQYRRAGLTDNSCDVHKLTEDAALRRLNTSVAINSINKTDAAITLVHTASHHLYLSCIWTAMEMKTHNFIDTVLSQTADSEIQKNQRRYDRSI